MPSNNVLIKAPTDDELFNIDFGSRLDAGETLTGAVITADVSGLTIGSPVASSEEIQVRISGGVTATLYTLSIVATTSAGNTLTDKVGLLVNVCYWLEELVQIFRLMIGDTTETPTYTDIRLGQTILAGAREVASTVSFDTTYYVNVNTLTLSPDPTLTATRDDPFINLILMKAACVLARAEFKKAGGKSFSVKDGPSSIDTRGVAQNSKMYADDVCKEYEEAVYQFVLGHRNPGEAIIGPYKIYGQHGWVPTTRDRTYFS